LLHTRQSWKEYSSLVNQRNEAGAKCKAAIDDYNRLVGQYNGSEANAQMWLQEELTQRSAVANQRKADLNELDARLARLLADKSWLGSRGSTSSR
jgi:hypothetical protein